MSILILRSNLTLASLIDESSYAHEHLIKSERHTGYFLTQSLGLPFKSQEI